MADLDQKLQSARQRQKGSILNEAKEASTNIIEVTDYSPESDSLSAISSSLKSILGGKLKVDCIHVYRMQKDGFEHFFIQPFSGLNPIPGEHHAIVEGNFRYPLALTRTKLGGSNWYTEDDDLKQRLNNDPALKQIVDQVKWEWAIGFGTVKLDWTIQMCPHMDGKSHLVLAAGRYGGVTTFHVGIQTFLSLSQYFANILHRGNQAERQDFLLEPPYADLIRSILSVSTSSKKQEGILPDTAKSATAFEEAASAEASVDFREIIHSALQPLEGKKVHVVQLPEKKEKNVRKYVLPKAVQDVPIVAVIDITMVFSSAKDAIVFTPDHCYAKEVDDAIDFALADLETVHGFTGFLEDKIDIEVRGLGRITIPCGGEGKAAMEVLQRIASRS